MVFWHPKQHDLLFVPSGDNCWTFRYLLLNHVTDIWTSDISKITCIIIYSSFFESFNVEVFNPGNFYMKVKVLLLLLWISVNLKNIYTKSFIQVTEKIPDTKYSLNEISLHFKPPVIQIISLGNSSYYLVIQTQHSILLKNNAFKIKFKKQWNIASIYKYILR